MRISRLSSFLDEHRLPWLQALLVSSVLLLSASLVLVASKGQLIAALLLILGVGLVLICLRWPALGLIVAALAGLVVPFFGPGGVNVTVVLIALLLGLWLLDMVARQRQIRLATSEPIGPLFCLLVIAFVSFGVGQLPWFSFVLHAPLNAQLGGLAIIVLSVGAFLLAANTIPDLRWLRWVTWAFLAFALVYIMVRSILPEFGLPTHGFLQQASSAFFVWLVALAFSQAVFNGDLHPGWRLALAGVVLLTLYELLYFKFADKSAWLPALLCIAVIIGARSWRAGLALIPVAALAAYYLAPLVTSSEDYSISSRFDAWLIMAQIIKVSPIWGLGFGNYYHYTPLFPIRGYAVSFNSHNNYIDILAQTGLVGLVCFLWFFWEMSRLGWRLREHVPSGFARAYVYGALGGLAGTIVLGILGDWVLPFVYNIGLSGFRASMLAWLFMGGLVSIEKLTRTAASSK
jgi:hypothetical protein